MVFVPSDAFLKGNPTSELHRQANRLKTRFPVQRLARRTVIRVLLSPGLMARHRAGSVHVIRMSPMTGPLVPSASGLTPGTRTWLVCLTSMNHLSKSQFGRPRRRSSGTKPNPKRRSPKLSTDENPARQFLVCVGWLRLLQALVFERRVLRAQGGSFRET